VSGDGDEEPVGVARIDRELRNLLAVAQTEVRPGFARVSRLVDAVSDRQVWSMQTFAAADVDDVRI